MQGNVSSLVFFPVPRLVECAGGATLFEDGVQVVFEGTAAEWAGCVRPLLASAFREAGIREVSGGGAALVRVVCSDVRVSQPEAYRLTVEADGALLEAATAAGAFYGAVTFRQLARQAPGTGVLPHVRIEDWPDFPHRGFMLDVSRCKVPKMSELFVLADLMAELKLNQLQLYTEHAFAYRAHRCVWEQASPLTAEEIRALDAYCHERHIELVPNQNSFGHMERWLCHAEYAHLAEAPDGFMTPWGERRGTSSTLWAAHPGALELVGGLYDELLPNFSSRLFNVGCDETFDLGQGRSAADCDARGKGRVYLEFLLKIHKLAQAHGRTMQFWGDIILHYPELIPELPRDVVPMVWGYEADHPFAEQCAAFAKAGFRFYVCPGTATWQTFGGRTANALANLRSAAEHGLTHGAEGCLITDWGDFGHLQPWAVSLLPLAYGAGLAWNVKSGTGTVAEAVPDFMALDRHLFQDTAGCVARAAYELGNVYRETGVLLHNASALFRLLLLPADKPLSKAGGWEKLTSSCLVAAEAAIVRAESALSAARPECAAPELLLAEFRQAAALMRLACRLGQARLASPDGTLTGVDSATRQELAAERAQLLEEQRRLWLARNREGGLAESLEWLSGKRTFAC